MRFSSRASAIVLAVLLLALVGCADDGAGDDVPATGQATTTDGSPTGGGNALGGNAMVRTLARAPLESEPPQNSAWNALRVELQAGEQVEHQHALSTVYAEDGPHTLTVGSQKQQIEPEGGAIVQAGQAHTHAATDQPSLFWDVLLAEPGAELPGVEDAERVFETEPLQGVPQRAQVAFLEVVLPPSGRTTVHTHPGPETIYVTRGPFEYENGIEGSMTVDAGDVKSIPPGTPVQKRNPGDGRPRFLSWFIVDPSKAFASPADFRPSE